MISTDNRSAIVSQSAHFPGNYLNRDLPKPPLPVLVEELGLSLVWHGVVLFGNMSTT